jgi:hypothetical protein
LTDLKGSPNRLRRDDSGVTELLNLQEESKNFEQAGRVRVYLVDLVCFVYLVSFVQPNKPDRPDKPNNGLLRQADFFSILL